MSLMTFFLSDYIFYDLCLRLSEHLEYAQKQENRLTKLLLDVTNIYKSLAFSLSL